MTDDDDLSGPSDMSSVRVGAYLTQIEAQIPSVLGMKTHRTCQHFLTTDGPGEYVNSTNLENPVEPSFLRFVLSYIGLAALQAA